MPSVAPSRCLCVLLVACCAPLWAQTSDTPTEEQKVHLEQLQHCRDGIIDAHARPEDRRRWIDILLSYETPESKALVVELIGFSADPDAQESLCEGIERHARLHPDRLDDSFVEPLIELLGSEAEKLRAAAARALTDFPSADVPTKLGALAVRADAPMAKRLAAIDALVTKVDKRSVIRELMTLLEAGVPEITERVVAALGPVSRETFGADVQRWHAWWAEKSRLSEEAWLADQLNLCRERVQTLQREAEAYRGRTERHSAALAARTGEFQRGVFRTLSPEQQAAKLAEWLVDPLKEVKLVALELITARMADEGRRPRGKVLASLMRLLTDESPAIRREVLEIAQNLKNEATVVEAILARVPTEKDPSLRQAIFRALGKLQSPGAVSSLVLEIANPESPPECVREAANALGSIAAEAKDNGSLKEAVVALQSRYKLAPAENPDLRAALLGAMAGVADPSFAPEFLEAVEADGAQMIRPAIRGLQVIGEQSKLPRLRTLTAHDDPLVRLAAIEAVGQLGGEDADIESVLTRLNPTIEPNEMARSAAWSAYVEFLAKRPVSVRLDYAKRLRDMPDLEVQYLQGVLADVSTANGHSPDADLIHDRIATALESQGKYADAVPHLRQLYEAQLASGSNAAAETGQRWLRAALRAPAQADVGVVVTELLSGAKGDDARRSIVEIVQTHLESSEVIADNEHSRTLLVQLRSIQSLATDTSWSELLQRTEDTLSSDSAEATSTPTP
ncbi:MAG: HEAT repeat domain-containing protein [Phycisphaerales bacterium]|nr:MAG: HEAT repeat domain-containing protein [Phycisphaerales bacterium]